ncbi:MAG: transcriptional repressor [Candidatus Staskawiczbacteria bacterium]|nr:transcriptional repressor [Candidatus Staskawiczbacteria bacterium]
MKSDQENQLYSLLRKAGMKATPGHLTILSFIQKSKKPISSQDIINGIDRHLDPATVYRCVTKLKENGIIRQIDLRQNNAHYEFFDMAHHHHIICTGCGRIEDIEDCNLETVHQQILGQTKGFTQIKHHSLEFYGLCKKCNSKN